MGLFSIIDYLLVCTYYLGWGIALVCIPMSAILLFANLGTGFAAAAACVAGLFAAVGVTLLLLPKQVKLPLAALAGRRFVIGGLPTMNLLFV